MFYNILDKKRLSILPLLNAFKKDFYLAGGTALALQIGHRDSIDFDFFCPKDIDTKKLFNKIKEIFKGRKILKTQEEKNTLSVFIDGNIRLSFLAYKYKLNEKLIDEKNIKLASAADIGCMKLSAIAGRASSKDYIDLYFILKIIPLDKLIKKANKIMPELDANLILKSLVYFDDIEKEPINFKNNNNVDFQQVKKFLIAKVKKYSKKY
ncbi:nucleotidyl transferase AbiEii/AbiGii toxin family protein [Patescibacteria group bacterium]|nr:nucleotidyl transferase AbiEii/AbiGii toxin family protein [Patescibacteria group bacterium]MBU4601046.1 nucleotidyl transferase AbiEii/AbiGii toxin family protein [Patescibacteria group bacterium]MCG2698776.1 nucleotidyl transferase AbiEii/AbiGii toxin family protein [Candidatus Parcubacteria bacterium]